MCVCVCVCVCVCLYGNVKTDLVCVKMLRESAFSQDLDEVVKVLLYQSGESSSVFIREDVERALAEMVSAVTPSRCLVALVNGGLQ